MALPLFLFTLAAAGTPSSSPPPAAQPAPSAYQHSPVFAARGGSVTGYATVTIMSAVEVGPGRAPPGRGMKPKLITASGPGVTAQRVLAYEFE